MEDEANETLYHATLKLVFGILLLVVLALVLRESFPFSLNEYRLILSSETLTASAYDAHEISPDCDGEGRCWSGWFVEYEYRVPNSDRVYKGSSHLGDEMPDRMAEENLPQPIEIEYVPAQPSLSRAKDSANRQLGRVITGDLFGVLVVLSVVVGGGYLVFSGFRSIWNFPKNPIPAVFGTFGKLIYGILFFVLLGVCSYYISVEIRSIFLIPDEKYHGLSGIIFLLLFPLALYVNLRVIEFFEARADQTKDDN